MVGDRVPGTGTAVYNAPQLEPRLVFGAAQIGMRTKDGRFYENTEIVPDLLVPTDPNFIAEGRDPQLEAAVKALLAEIDGSERARGALSGGRRRRPKSSIDTIPTRISTTAPPASATSHGAALDDPWRRAAGAERGDAGLVDR